MKHVDEYRDSGLARILLEKIRLYPKRELKFMEVCGSHTVAIFKSGIRDLLPSNISLVSGPGCPVCVTAVHDIDKAVAMSKLPGVIMASFGDMMRVPGSDSSPWARQGRRGGRASRVFAFRRPEDGGV